MNISEETFAIWSRGPSQTETDKCGNAENAVKKAIKASTDLTSLDISVFAQGSYRNRTNVRQDSDVDICIRYNSNFFPKYPEGKTREDYGNSPGTMAFADFKCMVHKALESYFGQQGVTRGNKAFDIHANSYRVDADVVPTFEYRRYTDRKNADGSDHYFSGVAFKPDQGNLIVNWPQQSYDNGISRNTETGRSYKRAIRILKRLRGKMVNDDIAEAKPISSFLIECLVWNAKVAAFTADSYTAMIRHIIANVWNNTREDKDCENWLEVNRLKGLFRNSQPWTRQQANAFMHAAWNYIGYK